MRFSRMINVAGVHAEGELNEVITGGVLDVPGATMFDKMTHIQTKADWLRQFLLNEPRGKVTQCVNLVLPASNPKADAGFVIVESDYYVPMSGTNTICTVTALLETGKLPMTEPVTQLTLVDRTLQTVLEPVILGRARRFRRGTAGDPAQDSGVGAIQGVLRTLLVLGPRTTAGLERPSRFEDDGVQVLGSIH